MIVDMAAGKGPAAETRGHATTGEARWWKDRLAQVLEAAPRLAP